MTVPRVAKAEAVVDGTEAVAAGAAEEDAAVKVVAGMITPKSKGSL